jgi:adenine-specific DNA-methyltransferase
MERRLAEAIKTMYEDGVIFISIDDSFVFELKVLCDKIFAKKNFLGLFITKQAIRSNSKHINTVHEYVIAYAKNKSSLGRFQIKRIDSPIDGPMIKDIQHRVRIEFKSSGIKNAEKLLTKLNNEYMSKRGITWLRNYSAVDSRGEIFFPKDLSVPGTPSELIIPEIDLCLPALRTRRWSSKEKIVKLYKQNRLFFKGNRPYEVHYLSDSFDNVISILDFYSRQGTNDLNKLGLRGLFDTPKPVELIKYLIRISTYNKTEAKILDFFAGSGTTGQAVMEVNKEDDKNHTFCLVQLDEAISKNTEQYKFAIKHNINPSVDQLLLHRLNVVKNSYENNINLKVLEVK